MNRRIDSHYCDCADVGTHLDDALNLLTDCADIYRRCDDANRRLCTQALFTKVYINDDELSVEINRSFEMLLDPEVNTIALNWRQNDDKARTLANRIVGWGSSLVRGVGPEVCGFNTSFTPAPLNHSLDVSQDRSDHVARHRSRLCHVIVP
ncbi:hypothetical protein [Micrococcoides hystricis]|uniref:Uncharacterized protein n=1 Tax=Micrococcoides hystricis TaxID=1572761 RepID=A0ABV6PC78_9MICC